MGVGLAVLNLVTRTQLRAQEADAEPPWGMAREPPAHLSASLVCCRCCGLGFISHPTPLFPKWFPVPSLPFTISRLWSLPYGSTAIDRQGFALSAPASLSSLHKSVQISK